MKEFIFVAEYLTGNVVTVLSQLKLLVTHNSFTVMLIQYTQWQ